MLVASRSGSNAEDIQTVPSTDADATTLPERGSNLTLTTVPSWSGLSSSVIDLATQKPFYAS